MNEYSAAGKIRHTPRCSYCRYKGHTRRRCFVLRAHCGGQFSASSEDKSAIGRRETSIDEPKARHDQSVFVRTYGRMPPSPHVVDLRDESARAVWKEAPVYSEPPSDSPALASVHFGAMVSAAQSARLSERLPQKSVAPEPFFQSLSDLFWRAVRPLEGSFRRLPAFFDGRHLRLPAFRLATVLIVALLIVPFPAIGYYQRLKESNAAVVAESTNGFLALQSSTVAALHANMDAATSDLENALRSFAAASGVLEREHEFLLSLVKLLPYVGSQVESRQALLSSGQHLALGNTYVVKGIREAQESEASLTDRFRLIRAHLRSAIPQYEAALGELYRVKSEAIPAEYQTSFDEFRALFETIVADMRSIVGLIDALDAAFGGDAFRRYLVVFQNQHEIRPTGGFMGSFAILDVEKGKIKNIEVPPGGAYDLQGQLPAYVKPPSPLLLVNGRWELQDANWFPDFAESAKKIAWFYEQSRGATVDGVIAVNGSVLERLLRVTGPVTNEKYKVSLASDNVLATLQDIVEHGEDKSAGRPKAVLSVLLEQLLGLVSEVDGREAMTFLSELLSALQEKEIQAYVRDEATQNVFRSFGWTGEIRQMAPGQDYLAVISANLQGQKSDARVKQEMEHQAVVGEDGSITNTVLVRRTHAGSPGEPLYGVSNTSYVRFYVPAGSELVEAGGFEYPNEASFHAPETWYKEDGDIARLEDEVLVDPASGTRVSREFGKTVFGNWMIVPPGETREAYVSYRLPWRAFLHGYERTTDNLLGRFRAAGAPRGGRASSYALFVQKQSGTKSDFSTRVIYPEDWLPAWRSSEEISLAKNGASFRGPLVSDVAIGLVMERSLE